MNGLVVHVLRAARARIEQPEHWCKRALAQNRQGDSVFELDEEAVRWCATGALFVEVSVFSSRHVERVALEQMEHCIPAVRSLPKKPTIADFNDAEDTIHADILALYDCAIAKAEAEGGE